jgi:four helix bundle protein
LEIEMQFNFEKLIVWQKGMELVDLVYDTTEKFPKKEAHVLAPQLLRAINSVPSNVAEGSYRRTKNEFIQYLYIAKGSLAEVLTLIEIARRRDYIDCDEQLRRRELSKEFFNLSMSLVKTLSKESKNS